jgi:hypothetical protein
VTHLVTHLALGALKRVIFVQAKVTHSKWVTLFSMTTYVVEFLI